MKKSILVILMIFILTASFSSAVLAEKITLRMAWWGSQNRHIRTLQVIKMYEKLHPEIDIEPQYTGWTGYW